MEAQRVRLGELLVRAGLISRQQLDETLALQQRDGRRLGTLLVESGLVSEAQVTQILSQQLSVPWVSLHHIDFSEQLLRLVPRDVVERYCLVPIYVRRVRGLGDALYVAMDDPTNSDALAEVARHAALHVRAMIAPPEAIRTAIRDNYGLEIPADFGSGVAHPRPEAAREESRAPEESTRGKEPSIDEDADTGVHWRHRLVSGMVPTELAHPSTERAGSASDVDELLAAHGAGDVDTLLAEVTEVDMRVVPDRHGLWPMEEGLITEKTGQLSADDPDVIEIAPGETPIELGANQRRVRAPAAADEAAEPLPLSRRSSSPGASARVPNGAEPSPARPPRPAADVPSMPSAGQQPVSGPRVVAPSVSRPPVVAPTVSRPPAVAPTVSRPPVVAPTVSRPPVVAPTVSRPPAVAPTVSRPPAVTPSGPRPPSVAPSPMLTPAAAPTPPPPSPARWPGAAPPKPAGSPTSSPSPAPPALLQPPAAAPAPPRLSASPPHVPSSGPPKEAPSRPASPPSSPASASSHPPPSARPPPIAPQPASPAALPSPQVLLSPPPPLSSPAATSRPPESSPRSGVPRRGVSVTLLDGTTLSLPGGRGPTSSREPDAASVRDVVAALRATARGADVHEVLGPQPRWEQMFAALLAILVRKGLLTDREFLDEIEKG